MLVCVMCGSSVYFQNIGRHGSASHFNIWNCSVFMDTCYRYFVLHWCMSEELVGSLYICFPPYLSPPHVSLYYLSYVFRLYFLLSFSALFLSEIRLSFSSSFILSSPSYLILSSFTPCPVHSIYILHSRYGLESSICTFEANLTEYGY